MERSRILKSAWLVTWEHVGDHARPKSRVVAILNYRWSGQRVGTFVEQLYVTLGKSAWDKLGAADKPRSLAYPAEFGSINGVRWDGEVRCGHNPWLQARMVNNLSVVIHDDGREEVLWTDRPIPKIAFP